MLNLNFQELSSQHTLFLLKYIVIKLILKLQSRLIILSNASSLFPYETIQVANIFVALQTIPHSLFNHNILYDGCLLCPYCRFHT